MSSYFFIDRGLKEFFFFLVCLQMWFGILMYVADSFSSHNLCAMLVF